MNRQLVLNRLRALHMLGFNAQNMRVLDEQRRLKRDSAKHMREALANALLREGKRDEGLALVDEGYAEDNSVELLAEPLRETCSDALKIIDELRELVRGAGVEWVGGVREAGEAWRGALFWVKTRGIDGGPIIEAVAQVTNWAGERADALSDELENDAGKPPSKAQGDEVGVWRPGKWYDDATEVLNAQALRRAGGDGRVQADKRGKRWHFEARSVMREYPDLAVKIRNALIGEGESL